MKITKVRIKKFENENSTVKGIAEVTLNNCFVVKDIRIIEKPEKMVVAMPSRSVVSKNFDEPLDAKRKHKDLAHPINKETREIFNEIILKVYNNALENDYEEDLDVIVCKD